MKPHFPARRGIPLRERRGHAPLTHPGRRRVKPGGDETLVVALLAVIVVAAAVIYLAAIPRNSVQPLATSGTTGTGETPTAQRPTPEPPPLTVDLAVTVWPHGTGRPSASWVLSCPPMTAACRVALARQGDLRAERRAPCAATPTRGNAEALVNGRVSGRYVLAWLDQRDACGAARWRALRPLLTNRPPDPTSTERVVAVAPSREAPPPAPARTGRAAKGSNVGP
jgi:hypothetical protein